MVYDWCTSLLANMKIQLTDCKQGRKRNFGFTSILCSFFFEQVPGLGPRVEIVLHGPHDPAMARWTEVMRRLGGGRVPTPYNDEFFFWWQSTGDSSGGLPLCRDRLQRRSRHAITTRFRLRRHRYAKVF
jgi:hypothetical protein